ncbi:mitochondrial fission regulator 2 [Corythoichthys intestinalis]|uniref:mitochondrial fission regulator 2 n=1 Tax=Corythoichthys intestinalis TaxID=161448 RepID=UPI0025A54EAD|nr:mitochondrial fission regulator 2 [Corythoichthys intestinalis]
MSLLEDALDLLRLVLDYFGVPPEVLLHVRDGPPRGRYRSIVRMIGSGVPLAPAPRVYFQIPLLASGPQGYADLAVETPAVPSFADVLWVLEDEGENFAKTRHHLAPRKLASGPARRQKTEPDALRKISALESELLELRAQIAAIVTAGLPESRDPPGRPSTSAEPPAALASAPLRGPPPAPPLPPPFSPSSVGGPIRRRDENTVNRKPSKAVQNLPSMLDVLKDLNGVKLRAVQRSPGGTPVRRRRSKRSGAEDPAALIARALERKFARHRRDDSSDKENSPESSPFGSPDEPETRRRARRIQRSPHL